MVEIKDENNRIQQPVQPQDPTTWVVIKPNTQTDQNLYGSWQLTPVKTISNEWQPVVNDQTAITAPKPPKTDKPTTVISQNQPTTTPVEVKKEVTVSKPTQTDQNLYWSWQKTEKTTEQVVQDKKTLDYTDNSPERQWQIITNLNNFATTNPDMFKDKNTFYSAFDYSKRNQWQQKLLDSWYNENIQKDRDIKKAQSLSGYTGMDLVNMWLSNEDIDTVRKYNPDKYNEYLKAKWDYSFVDNLNAGTSKDTPKKEDWNTVVEDSTKSLVEKLQGMFDSMNSTNYLEEYKKTLNTPEITEAKNSLNKVAEEINAIDDKLKNMQIDFEKQFEWTGATAWYIAARVSQAQRELYRERDSKQRAYDSAKNNLTTLTDEAKTNFDLYTMQKQEQRQQLQDKLTAFNTAYWLVKDERQWQWDKWADTRALEQLKKQYDLDQQYKYWDINSTNPMLQKKAVETAVTDLMSQYSDWKFQRSKVQMTDDVLKLVKEWKTLWEAIKSNITDQLNQNPAFKSYISWQDKTNKSEYIEHKLKDWTVVMVNKYDPADQFVLWVDDVDTADKAMGKQDWTYWWQCWAFVNKILWSKVFWNSVENKISKINSQVPTKWSVVVMESKQYPENWHVAIVTAVDWDTLTIKESNAAGNEKISTREININHPTIKWYYNKGVDNSDEWNKEAKALWLVVWLWGTVDERKELAANIIKESNDKWITLQEAKKSLWYKTADDIEFAKSRKEDYKSIKKYTKDQLTNANTTLTLLDLPQTAIWDVATVVWFLRTIDPSSVARESEVSSVENARWILASLGNTFDKADSWKKLTTEQRQQLKNAITTIVNAWNSKYNEFISETVWEFNDRWLDPSVYIPNSEISRAIPKKAETPTSKLYEWVNNINDAWSMFVNKFSEATKWSDNKNNAKKSLDWLIKK